jgi:hypothetical protein
MWMKCCISLQHSVHILLQCSPKCTEKSSIHVSDDAPWYPKVHLDLFKEHVCCFLSFDGLLTRHENALLSTHLYVDEML